MPSLFIAARLVSLELKLIGAFLRRRSLKTALGRAVTVTPCAEAPQGQTFGMAYP